MNLMTLPTSTDFGRQLKEDLGQQIEVDEAVLSRLPAGTQILSASRHGTDRWARSAKLVAKHADGSVRAYLLRGSAGESGKQMMRGEFESCAAIHNAVPTFCARPIGWGAFKSKPNTYYNLSHFHERVSPPRDPAAFAALLARLHTRAKPPADHHHHHQQRFGFPVATFVGGEVLNEPIAADTWEEAFTQGLKQMLALDDEINGVDEALVALREELIARVIPRLLRPLRGIAPALCHGYLCAANAGVSEDGDTMVWRPAALFAHNEFELGMWRAVANGFDGRFVRAYLKHVPISEPADDFEMRNALYALRHTVAASIRFPGSDKYRLAVRDEIAALVGRFSPGPEWPLLREENEDVVVELDAEGVAVLVAAGTVASRVVRPAGTRVKSKSIVGGKLVKR